MSEPRIHTVDFVAERLTRGTPRWVVHHVDQEGNGGSCIFPKETLEWRAAEYGLTDVTEILDIVLHEFHLPDEPGQDDAAARAGIVTSNRPDAEPITLFNARSAADALAAHRLRIADAKRARAHVRSPAKGKDPLDTIRAAHGITPDGLRAKREAVDIQRWQLVYGALPVRPPSQSSLLEVPRA
ncbi:hypothetical protein ACWGJ6_23050 [Streptomyces canus]